MSAIAPAEFTLMRTIGPFDRKTLPAGLLSEHRLKPGRWGRLRVTEGAVTLLWDDGTRRADHLYAPAEALIPPEVPHHLEFAGEFRLEIDFLATS